MDRPNPSHPGPVLQATMTLQGLPDMSDERLHLIGQEIAALVHLARHELPPLEFDDQPSDFRAAQSGGTVDVG